jgi:hypothetical protein
MLATRRVAAAAGTILLLLAGGCTPSVVLKSGPDYDAAVALAQAYCAAAATPDPADERALFDDELRARFDAVDPAERDSARLLTSADPRPLCRVTKVRTFGPPPDHIIGIRVRLELQGATDVLYLSNAYGRLRVGDLTYGRPRRIGSETAHSLVSALYILKLEAEKRRRAAQNR